jgi:NAD(P)-dependent dehydrogenase (short-subunit alcohol dehydrogenase family)
MKWTLESLPNQNGKTAIVTGANAGIGYETAKALAGKEARVILACRSRERGEAALKKIRETYPQAQLELHLLDLTSLDSVRQFATEIIDKYPQLDLLINNAGVMMPPESKTKEGFELQIGVNFLGHFLLTGLLLELLEKTPGARVVTLSSIAHRSGRINLDNFKGEKPYMSMREYGQSKLACLMFALELQKRLDAKGSKVLSLAAHPGWTQTELMRHQSLADVLSRYLAMPTLQGALPTLFAATAPLPGGTYTGPNGFFEAWGFPATAKIRPHAQDAEMQKKLWQKAESLTGISFLSA